MWGGDRCVCGEGLQAQVFSYPHPRLSSRISVLAWAQDDLRGCTVSRKGRGSWRGWGFPSYDQPSPYFNLFIYLVGGFIGLWVNSHLLGP